MILVLVIILVAAVGIWLLLRSVDSSPAATAPTITKAEINVDSERKYDDYIAVLDQMSLKTSSKSSKY
jgi:hypothetical protein